MIGEWGAYDVGVVVLRAVFLHRVIIEIRLGAFEINLGFVSASVICQRGSWEPSLTVTRPRAIF